MRNKVRHPFPAHESRDHHRRLDYAQRQKRLLAVYLAWPATVVALLGLVGFLFTPVDYRPIWLALALSSFAGVFLPVGWAFAVGMATLISTIPWLFTVQQTIGLNGELLIAFSVIPFAPIWLSATRNQQKKALRLMMLMELPQVRASLDVSDWSLLPTPRALDQRMTVFLNENAKREDPYSAIILKIHLVDFNHHRVLMGEHATHDQIMDLANDMRITLRNGDMIAEDVLSQGNLYVFAVPNRDFPDSHAALIRRITETLKTSALAQWHIDYAFIPDDGRRLFELNWHKSI